MTKLILLDNYNNYYNRISRKSSTVEDYIAGRNYRETGFVNFNPADGVSTSHIINWPESWNPDYCLVVDEADNIISRWFIIESTRTRGGQYELSLKRDSIADNFDVIKSAPAYLLKGCVGIDNPLIFNSEGQQFNQIKTGEYPIKDDTNCAWIVGYMADSGDQKVSTLNKTISIKYNPTTLDEPDMSFQDIDSWYFGKYVDVNTPYQFTHRVVESMVNTSLSNNTWKSCFPVANIMPGSKEYDNSYTSPHLYESGKDFAVNGHIDLNVFDTYKDALPILMYGSVNFETIRNVMSRTFRDKIDESVGKQIWSLDGKTVRDEKKNIVYRCHVTIADQQGGASVKISGTDITDILNEIPDRITFQGNEYELERNAPDIWINALWNYVRLTLEVISEASYIINFTDPEQAPYPLDDAPYYMFAIPYGDTPIDLRSSGGYITMSKSLALNLASKLSVELGSFIYDIQMLPYCPIKNLMIGGYITPKFHGDNYDVMQSGKTVGVVIWGSVAQFSFTKKIEVSGTKKAINPIEYKTASETELYRLCAPNYSGSFDWNPYKNDTKFPETREISLTVDCTYRPYTPYIHITPLKGYMYGGEFGDSRGLICGGDYSLTQLNSAWTNYQINNKNYQNIFDRQVSRLDFYQNIDRIQSILNIGTSRAQGAAMGASMGAAGGPIGMAVGASVGATAGSVSGVADAIVSELERKEEKDYMVSMYNFQLGNIQAMPYSLTKVSVLSNNFKFWPFIETYKASQPEIDSMYKKLSYEGMLLSVISDVSTSVKATPVSSAPGKYVKGNFITLEQLADDTHMALDLNNELSKGLYITEEV